mgnify:CR=1 FL=1
MLKEYGIGRRGFLKSVCAATGAAVAAGSADAKLADDPAANRWGAAARPGCPQRLNARIHELAELGLSGTHGKALQPAGLLSAAEARGLTKNQAYAVAARRAAEEAPLRILPGERIVGSATLLEASQHQVPYLGVASTSHTTLGWHRVLDMGYAGLRHKIEERLARGFDDERDIPEPAPAGTPALCDSPFGKAMRMSAAGQYWYAYPSSPQACEAPLTAECWARLDSADRFNVLLLNKSKDSRHHWEIYAYAGSGCFSAYLPGFAPAEIVSDRVITDGEWHHLAMVFMADRVQLYVDGEQVKDQAVRPAGQLGEGGGELYVGGFPWGPLGADGAIAAARVTNGARHIQPGMTPAGRDSNTVLWFRPDGRTETARLQQGAPLSGAAPPRNKGKDLLESMLACLDAAAVWHQRHLDLLDERIAASTGAEQEHYRQVRAVLERVPENPPETFHEAVQSLWFMYAFQRLMGTWSGIGRIDAMLGPYLEKDLDAGRITLDEARELLAHFWVKGTEWIGNNPFAGSGDAQFYQNIILSGVDAQGNAITNEVTYLVLDVVEELHISDFPIAVRLNRNTPERLLRRMAEVQRHGGGIVAAYNEEAVIEGLVKFGYPREIARGFTNDGCWETLIPGETSFIYVPFDALVFLHEVLGLKNPEAEAPAFETFEDLYAAYLERLKRHIDGHHNRAPHHCRGDHPAPLVSMFVEDCIERGRSYYDRGPRYTVMAAHAGGLADVGNSLLVLKKLVYEDRYLPLAEFIAVLRNDWDGQEHLRRLVQRRFTFYGNDTDASDRMVARVFNDYTALVARVKQRDGVLMPAGISTFGREIGWVGPDGGRAASPSGHHAADVLATNCSPTPGSDRQGPTAVLKSYCKLDFTRTPNGATVELKIHPESVKGDAGAGAIAALMKSFVRLGGWFVHVDVMDTALLLDAQRHPEKYPNLPVRVAGWSARFATLDKSWQDMIIGRTQQYV